MNDAILIIVFIAVPFWLIYTIGKRTAKKSTLFPGQTTREMKIFAIGLGILFAGMFIIEVISSQTIHLLFPILAFAFIGYGMGAGQLLSKFQNQGDKADSVLLSINMDGATFFKTSEDNIIIKRETTYIWLLTAIFGAFELILLRIVVSDAVQGKGLSTDYVAISAILLIGAALFQNIRSLRQPSVIKINAISRMVEIGRGTTKKQFLFSQITQVSSINPQTLHFGIMRIARMEIQLKLNNGEVIKLGSVSGVNYSRATAISQHIEEVTGATIHGDLPGHQVHIDPQTTKFESKQKEKPMNFFKNLFSKDEPFVPTPILTIPGLEPIVVQAVENLFPNTEDQKQVFEYSLKYFIKEGSKGKTLLYLLALLSYSKGKVENLVDLGSPLLHDMHFMTEEITPIFPSMKAAEEWVKSTTKPPASERTQS